MVEQLSDHTSTVRAVKRFTTRYHRREDRIALSFEYEDGSDKGGVWLTHRLLKQLTPTLAKLLQSEKIQLSGEADAIHRLAQHEAVRVVNTDAYLQPPVDQDLCPDVLTIPDAIKFDIDPSYVTVHFESRDENVTPCLKLTATQIRQWLNMLYQQSISAEWATDAFPDWVKNCNHQERSSFQNLH